MKLNRWLLISKHAEEKKIRTNLKKLGCLFEAFIGAIFLDFNKVDIYDEAGWFQDVFVRGSGFQTGIGFQMAQKFIESIFEKHINWYELISNDNNYKNILQVRIQKEFKVTPLYLELGYDNESGYIVGVYLCIGRSIHEVSPKEALYIDKYDTFDKINEHYEKHSSIFLLMGNGRHKIKRKAEQLACQEALNKFYNNTFQHSV